MVRLAWVVHGVAAHGQRTLRMGARICVQASEVQSRPMTHSTHPLALDSILDSMRGTGTYTHFRKHRRGLKS